MTIPIEHQSAVLSVLPRLCRGEGEVALAEIAADLGWSIAYAEEVGWFLVEQGRADSDVGLGDQMVSLNCCCEACT